MRTAKADEFIDKLLREHNNALAEYLGADVVTLRSPIRFGFDDAFRQSIESIQQDGVSRRKRLAVIVETNGGYIEVVERMYMVMRKHYPDHVAFIVPNFAYSAGTVLVLSGDEIFMDYYSILGPIDAQYENVDKSGFVPGMGYLAKYDELVSQINSATNPSTVQAQLAFLVEKFDPAELFKFEQARAHSQSLLEAWLPKHKFKNWNITTSTKVQVTDDMRKRRAGEIANCLGNASRWHSHGRGIGMKELTSDELKLRINDFGENPELNHLIRVYYELFIDYCHKIGCSSQDSSVIHTSKGLRRY